MINNSVDCECKQRPKHRQHSFHVTCQSTACTYSILNEMVHSKLLEIMKIFRNTKKNKYNFFWMSEISFSRRKFRHEMVFTLQNNVFLFSLSHSILASPVEDISTNLCRQTRMKRFMFVDHTSKRRIGLILYIKWINAALHDFYCHLCTKWNPFGCNTWQNEKLLLAFRSQRTKQTHEHNILTEAEQIMDTCDFSDAHELDRPSSFSCWMKKWIHGQIAMCHDCCNHIQESRINSFIALYFTSSS